MPPIMVTFSPRSREAYPPISKLTEDILWLIFTTISASEEDHVIKGEDSKLHLDTIRANSQVCQRWRYILLKTSTIWGRLMNWRALNQETDEWRNEVLRRSGTSLLWVRGYAVDTDELILDDCYPKLSTRRFFERLLFEHWGRIECLAAFLSRYKPNKALAAVVSQAAPHLRVFIMPDRAIDYDEFSAPMFAGHAPRLTVFHAIETGCNLDPAWMSNIRDLYLGSMFNNKDVCTVLPHLPRLESLKLEQNIIIDGYQPKSPIRLPNLRILDIFECMPYIQDLAPAPGCALELSGEYTVDEHPLYATRIAKITHQSFSRHPVEQIDLECTFTTFNFRSHYYSDTERKLVFDIGLFLGHEAIDTLLEGLLHALCSPHFSAVKRMQLKYEILSPRVYRAFQRFASLFSTLDYLEVDPHDIQMLAQCGTAAANPIIFPSLRTLSINLSLSDGMENWTGALESFLSLRLHLRLPAVTVNIISDNGVEISLLPVSLRSLAEFTVENFL